jgi:hypothetical protein
MSLTSKILLNEIHYKWLTFRVTIGTWNVAGLLPCNDLDIEDWLCIQEPSDIYIIGLVYFTMMS